MAAMTKSFDVLWRIVERITILVMAINSRLFAAALAHHSKHKATLSTVPTSTF
jgi:hypothetical protein